MMLPNYICGTWVRGGGDGHVLHDPVTGAEVARVSSAGVAFADALAYGRAVGGAALRSLGYRERAALLGRVAEVLTANREAYGAIALANMGATAADAGFDIDGAIYTLKYYAKAGAALGDARLLRDGAVASLSRDGAFAGLHIATPLRGVAITINAFNFPAWGLWEKAAAALLSGVPVLAKPATATAWLAQRMVEDVVNAGVLPPGALSIVCGPAGDLLEHVASGDVVVFTGGADTAASVRAHPHVARQFTRVNVEADSVNVAILGPDVAADAPEAQSLVREVQVEMTLKAGQKCTAIRRVLVPRARYRDVVDAIGARLAQVAVGNPRNPAVRMGPLASRAQQRRVLDSLAALRGEAHVVFEGPPSYVDADPTAGAFVPITLLGCEHPSAAVAVHDVEAFGPVATVMPYDTFDEAVQLAARGGGSLVASVYTADAAIIQQAVEGLAPSHGRVNLVDASVAKTATGHGNVMPQSLHGGPGRAGNGQELGGLRALRLYHQLSVIQAPRAGLDLLAAAAAAAE